MALYIVAAEVAVMPRIAGMNPFHIEAIWDRMYRCNRKPVAKGLYISAMGAVDIAVWDIIGKALNRPVCEVLGVFSNRIRCMRRADITWKARASGNS